MNVMNALSKAVAVTKVRLVKASPEISLLGGLVFAGIGIYQACKATIAATEIVAEANQNLENVEAVQDPESDVYTPEYTEEQAATDKKNIAIQTATKLTKCYGKAAVCLLAALVLIVLPHHIYATRIATGVAAYQALLNSHNQYRDRVRALGGEELEAAIASGDPDLIVDKLFPKDDTNENDEARAKAKEDISNCKKETSYVTYIEKGDPEWVCSWPYLESTARKIEDIFDRDLDRNGHVFLNEINDALGKPRTPEGQFVGWSKKSPVSDGHIDLRIRRVLREYVDGQKYPAIMIDPNVDGPIIDLI